MGLLGDKVLIILVIILLLFGGTKIPEMMRGLGQGMKEFKKATRDDDDDEKPATSSETTATKTN